MTVEEREARRLERQRIRQQRHRANAREKPRNTYPVACHMPGETLGQLDYLLLEHDDGRGRSGFLLRAFRHYAAFLMGSAPPAEAAADPPPAETPATAAPPARVPKAAKSPAKSPAKIPWSGARGRAVARAKADAANQVPVRIEFARRHDAIPWGMRQMMWDSGLINRKSIWRGTLPPERAESMAEQVSKFGGALTVTGGLGEAPKWAPGEYRKEA